MHVIVTPIFFHLTSDLILLFRYFGKSREYFFLSNLNEVYTKIQEREPKELKDFQHTFRVRNLATLVSLSLL